MKILKLFYKKIIFVAIALYVASIFISQQKNLNSYKSEINKYETQIAQEEERKQDLIEMKENANSTDFIEEIAREKLGMYLPNERVFIDIGK